MKKEITTPAGCRPYPTAKEQKEERQRIKAELKRMKMTRKKFSEKCKEIMASTELNEKGKKAEIEHAATTLIEDTINEFPEIRSIEERCTAIEEKHSGHKGITYCPECGTWSPKEPPAIKTLAREWSKIKDQKIDELCRKVLSGKAA
jgi:hypothetical protein